MHPSRAPAETAAALMSALPEARGCALFDTALGACGIAWRGDAVSQVLLPASDREATADMLQWMSDAEIAPEPWPAFVSEAVARMRALLRGEAADLGEVPLDWRGIGSFERRVYEATRRIPPGVTCTYGELARDLGEPDAARAVGVALGRNPWPLVVPCHRVLAAQGKLGGFSAPGGVDTKRRLLAVEAPLAQRPGELF
jgi:methylated-DNA-[protein]-cysteine S-methyltransferase